MSMQTLLDIDRISSMSESILTIDSIDAVVDTVSEEIDVRTH